MTYGNHTTTYCIEMLGVEIDLEVSYDYRPGTADSYYEPGDPPEVEIVSAVTPDGRDILDYLLVSRPNPQIEIVEETCVRYVHARQGFTSLARVREEYRQWVVKITGETYYEALYEYVSTNHEDDGGYDDDWDPRD